MRGLLRLIQHATLQAARETAVSSMGAAATETLPMLGISHKRDLLRHERDLLRHERDLLTPRTHLWEQPLLKKNQCFSAVVTGALVQWLLKKC